jgi:hypothetical protein
VLVAAAVLASAPVGIAVADGLDLETLLRRQVFNKEFEGYDSSWLAIEEDRPQSDGSREVLVSAGGKFLKQTKQLKALVLLVGDQVIGGQIIEKDGLSPCIATQDGDHQASL